MFQEHGNAEGDAKEVARQKKLIEVLRNRLEAVAQNAGKGPLEARRAMARIFAAIEEKKHGLYLLQPPENREYYPLEKLQPENDTLKTSAPQAASAKTRCHAKGETTEPEGPASIIWRDDYAKWKRHAVKPNRDFIAPFIRMTCCRMRKMSEEASIEEAQKVKKFDDLSPAEKRAALMLAGEGRATRNANDKATKIAKILLAEWDTPPKYPRPRQVHLTLEQIIRLAIPFIEELGGERLRGASDARYDAHLIDIEPPALGALVALARMHKKRASFVYVSSIVAKHYRN